jgi:hypothetical protein
VSKVFVSYRREDSAPYAGRICDRLEGALGSAHVFIDVEDIAPGMDFVQTLENTVGSCDVLVAVIGPRWLEILNTRTNDSDFVEHEIAAALQRGITIIPVLVGGAAMPSDRDLPDRLKGFARRQALIARDDGFDQASTELLKSIDRAAPRRQLPKRVLWGVVAAGVIIAVVGAALLLRSSRDRVALEGTWIARMQRPGRPAFNVRLHFRRSGRTLAGSVDYPTGTAMIEGGTVERGRLAFYTRHTPQFETEPAKIVFSGQIRGGEIDVIAITQDGAETKGIARPAN